MEVFKVWKVREFKKGKQLGYAMVLVADAMVVTGIRIFEGPNGRFVSMPQRKAPEGYKDICYPMNKELREQLQAAVLKAFDEKAAESERK